MTDKLPHPGRFEQHLLPLEAIDGFSGGALPANINRYFLRAVDVDAVRDDESAFVYSKLGKFIVLGFVDVAYPREWIGTEVHVDQGAVALQNYVLPEQFAAYLIEKSLRFAAVHRKISMPQRAKIAEAYRKNIERVAGSATLDAMGHDARLFGSGAFDIHKPNDAHRAHADEG